MAKAKAKVTKKGVNPVKDLAETATVLANASDPKITLRDGTVVTVYKCRAKDVGTVMELMAFVMEEFHITKLGDLPDINLEEPSTLMQLIAKSSDRLYLVAGDLCSLSYQQVCDLELDEAIKLLMSIVTLNMDFFSRQVMPMVAVLMPKSEEAKTAPEA